MSLSLFPNLADLPKNTVVQAMIAIQMKNLDALAAAQKAALDGMGTLARQQQDMLASSLKDFTAAPAGLVEADPRAAVAKPFDAAKSALLDGTAKANILTQLAAQSGGAVAEILQKRTLAALDEMKAAMLTLVPAQAQA